MIVRQGDVLLKRTTKQPSAHAQLVSDNGRTILAHGEATGHAHEVLQAVAEAACVPARKKLLSNPDPVPTQQLFEEPDGSRILVLKRDAELRHDEHGTIPLSKGAYEVIRQREYAPHAIRNVAD